MESFLLTKLSHVLYFPAYVPFGQPVGSTRRRWEPGTRVLAVDRENESPEAPGNRPLFVVDKEGLIQFEHVGHREDLFEVLSVEIELLKEAE